MMGKKKWIGMAIMISLALILSSCSSIGVGEKRISVGGKNFTEQYLLSEMTAFLLEEEGFKVKQMNNLGSTVVRKALENNQVDLMWEYTGTALITYMKQDPIADPDKTFEKVKDLDAKNDIHWMNMSKVNNTYALAMTKEKAEELDIHSISDLGEYINDHPDELTIASDAEFANRQDGLPGVEKKYGFDFGAQNINQMDIGLTQRALDKGQVDVSVAFETDATIRSYGLVTLDDDKQFFPPYRAAVSVNKDVLKKYPEIEEITGRLADKLDSEIMRELNYKVDIEGNSVSVVAYEWLVDNGMIDE
ncbi:glycine betaine ABC transporter substrate-binding protein [Rossellomorea marisflavi]|uniref:ABC transporter substrate-binding protein n=2 Tax=Rossellomorea marisflavi TaxID=189381 RepID=UPI00069E6D51|nr:glycine betaine ABC transporter substrate-binding protein [Rossellomorea marisflavi]TYO72649.1 glycine betaine ABC transporter substrate-binding protein [Rossellomorea marisflavi]USK90324.1 glycine betaine ABC transporter substrate-binding protein [Rossellomorea marisflavi]